MRKEFTWTVLEHIILYYYLNSAQSDEKLQ